MTAKSKGLVLGNKVIRRDFWLRLIFPESLLFSPYQVIHPSSMFGRLGKETIINDIGQSWGYADLHGSM